MQPVAIELVASFGRAVCKQLADPVAYQVDRLGQARVVSHQALEALE